MVKNITIPKKLATKWAVVAFGTLILVLFIGLVVLILRPVPVVSSFAQCREAGGALLETYPEQCMLGGTTFVNPEQSVSKDTALYMDLTEKAALSKAKEANVPARVVERDGEPLPVTMDFVFGRHNFYVQRGKVYKVEIEGQAQDS